MVDHDDHHIFGKIVLSPTFQTDGSQEHPHLQDDFDVRDGHTASPDSINTERKNEQILDEQHPKNLVEYLSEILQSVPIL